MKKKVISAILCAAMVSTMAVGCSSSDSKKDSKSDKKDGYKVAYIARAQEDSFAAWLADESSIQENRGHVIRGIRWRS